MKKVLLTIASASVLLTACGQQPMPLMRQMGAPNQLRAANAQAEMTLPRQKEESPLIENRNVQLTPSAFDEVAESTRSKTYPADSLYQQPAAQADTRSGFNSPFSDLPFGTWNDLRDYVKYGYSTVHEDNKYMDEYYARNHFNRYANGAFREVQRLYNASREDMKRFILLDVLANSLVVQGQRLPYEDVHNPPAERHYKLFPTQAAGLMPTFGEIVSYNRSSYEVNYVRWDEYRAARYYQANYSRIFGLIMEHGPSKREAWRLVHREISAYAGR